MSLGRWPVRIRVVLPDGRILVLRPLERGDRTEWDELRQRNQQWLSRWESRPPGPAGIPLPFPQLRRVLHRAGRAGDVFPFVIEVDGDLVGQMHLFDIIWGSRRSGLAGYWLDEAATGRGVATWALAALIDHALLSAGLHRVEIAIREENRPSLAMMQRLGLPEEGRARGLMFVEDDWRDHRMFAVIAEDVRSGGFAPAGFVQMLRERAA